jgi:hypothetical protein
MLVRPYLTNKLGMAMFIYNPRYEGDVLEAIHGLPLAKNMRSCPKYN